MKRFLLPAALMTLALVGTATGASHSGWTSASITNSDNSAKVTATIGTHSFTHTYPTSQTCVGTAGTASLNCPQTIFPATVPRDGTASAALTDAVKNTGTTTGITTSLSMPKCGAIQLANARGSNANPLLIRRGFTFNPSTGPMTGAGSVTLDGVGGATPGLGTSATAAKTVAWTTPTDAAQTAFGVWFKGTNMDGNLLTLGPDALARGNEKLQLNIWSGRLMLVSGGSSNYITAGSVNNGAWHFVYIVLKGPKTANDDGQSLIYLDGNTTATSYGAFYDADFTGYWRIANAATGLNSNTWAGSLSNFVVFRSTIPSPPTSTNLASQTSFDAWASNATQHWKMNDTGYTTYDGNVDFISTPASPACSQVNLTWSATSPTITAQTRTLASLVSTPMTGTGPDPNITQNNNFSIRRLTTPVAMDPDAQGLKLIPAIRMTHTSGTWSQAFNWNTGATPSNILID